MIICSTVFVHLCYDFNAPTIEDAEGIYYRVFESCI